jgi:FkbM family methyltransferase
MNRLCARPPTAFSMRMSGKLGGYSFECDLRDSISREVCFAGCYEPQETALVRAILRSGMCFVDVGANWGYFSLMAAYLVEGAGRVISLEPDPRLFSKLQENLAANHLEHVTALPLAAADRRGSLTMMGYDENGGNFGMSRVVARPPAFETFFRVSANSLDSILSEQEIGSVDLMKMDIEGAEAMALAGLWRSLSAGRIKFLLLELHPTALLDRGSSTQAVVEILRAAQYTGLSIDHSPSATHRSAYGRVRDLRSLLKPFGPADRLDAWPHHLWMAPGSAPPWRA